MTLVAESTSHSGGRRPVRPGGAEQGRGEVEKAVESVVGETAWHGAQPRRAAGSGGWPWLQR